MLHNCQVTFLKHSMRQRRQHLLRNWDLQLRFKKAVSCWIEYNRVTCRFHCSIFAVSLSAIKNQKVKVTSYSYVFYVLWRKTNDYLHNTVAHTYRQTIFYKFCIYIIMCLKIRNIIHNFPIRNHFIIISIHNNFIITYRKILLQFFRLM